VLRNCFVYFEMSVSSVPVLEGSNNMLLHHHLPPATLSIGLSTLEMPNQTLVGAWKGSVGLCTTGQILAAGQWCSPVDPRLSSYGNNGTVGCLVYLDDASAFQTWDGVMVTSSVTFNVNGQVVAQPLCAPPPVLDTKSTFSHHDDATRRSRDVHHPMDPQAGGPPTTTLPLYVPREEELFPTVTLHSPATQVMCRFCAEDIQATSRSTIGAPIGVVIYAVDGSVLFDEDRDDLFPIIPSGANQMNESLHSTLSSDSDHAISMDEI
jgi:hypothetical protein